MNLVEFFFLCEAIALAYGQLPLQTRPKQWGISGWKEASFEDVGPKAEQRVSYRLNNTFVPKRYEIVIRILPVEVNGTEIYVARGQVNISGVADGPLKRIILNAGRDLTVFPEMVKVIAGGNSTVLEIDRKNEAVDADFLNINLKEEVKAMEEIEILMDFETEIRQTRRDQGLFYRKFRTISGNLSQVFATQFQSVFFRLLVPSFDEPQLRAIFKMTVIHEKKYVCLSNTPVQSEAEDSNPNFQITAFTPTPVEMSTYHVALGCAPDYDSYEMTFKSQGTEKPVRTYGPKFLIDAGYGNYTTEAQKKILEYFEETFGVPYSFPKMDSIAVPGFDGAMENWGLNIYDPAIILYSPEMQTEAERRYLTNFISHELAHQWFGNHVTAAWWDVLYLNEAFASYFQYWGMQSVSSDLDADSYALLDSTQYALRYDASGFSDAVVRRVETQRDIEGMFSTAIYEKGACVLFMLELILTRKGFLSACQSYLKDFQYSSRNQSDLYQVLEKEVSSGVNVLPGNLTIREFMEGWTTQTGFPIVRVKLQSQNGTENRLLISQKRFRNFEDDHPETFWDLPITLVEGNEEKSGVNEILWLRQSGKEISVPLPEKLEGMWFMVNQDGKSYSRVLYDNALFSRIYKKLMSKPEDISALSRSQLLDDYFVFSKEGYTTIERALCLTEYLGQESHFVVWTSNFRNFENIYRKFSGHPEYSTFKGYLTPKMESALEKLKMLRTDYRQGSQGILYADLLDWLCSMESETCYSVAKVGFQNLTKGLAIVPLDVRTTLACAMVSSSSDDFAFEYFLEEYSKQNISGRYRDELLSVLACHKNPLKLFSLIQQNNSKIYDNDKVAVLAKIAEHPGKAGEVFKIILGNFDFVVKLEGSPSTTAIELVLDELEEYVSDDKRKLEVRLFGAEVEAKLHKYRLSIDENLEYLFEEIDSNVQWMNRVGSRISKSRS